MEEASPLITKCVLSIADLQAQSCSMDEENPFASICTPAQGVQQEPGVDKIKTYSSSQVVWLSEPRAAAVPLNPHIRVSNVKQVDIRTASFQVLFLRIPRRTCASSSCKAGL